MTLGLVQYVLGGKHLGAAGLPPDSSSQDAAVKAKRPLLEPHATTALVAVRVQRIQARSRHRNAGRRRRWLPAARPDRRVFRLAVLRARLDAAERKRLYVIGVLFLAASLFWVAFEQAGSTLNLFADRDTSTSCLRLGLPEQLVPVGELCVHHRSSRPLFAWMWVRLARPRQSRRAPRSSRSGPVLVGAGFRRAGPRRDCSRSTACR